MPAHSDKSPRPDERAATVAGPRGSTQAAPQFADHRAGTAAQLVLQALADDSPQVRNLDATRQFAQAGHAASHMQGAQVAQLEQKTAPDGNGTIDVDEVVDRMPICIERGVDGGTTATWKFYIRSGKPQAVWNDEDFFYAKGDDQLIQITVKNVNDYWDPLYEGFSHIEEPDFSRNCGQYAAPDMNTDGPPAASTAYGDEDALESLMTDSAVGDYVLNIGSHWMKLEKTGADAFTIRQKDAESAVYEKSFNKADAIAYIFGKYSGGGHWLPPVAEAQGGNGAAAAAESAATAVVPETL